MPRPYNAVSVGSALKYPEGIDVIAFDEEDL